MTDLRTLENDSIKAFVQSAADEGYLSGRVLDWGAGKQPWREIVTTAGGTYVPYDRAEFPGNTSGEDVGELPLYCNATLCTQVAQYVEDVGTLLSHMRTRMLNPSRLANPDSGGHLVLTYPTNWPEVEPEDLHRFTKAGMERLLIEAGFEIVRHEPRASVRAWVNEWITDEFVLGYGCVARA